MLTGRNLYQRHDCFYEYGERNNYARWHGHRPEQLGEPLRSQRPSDSSFREHRPRPSAEEHGIEKIIIIGMLANTCIESTGRFGTELGYHVTLVKDATAGLQSRGDACGARDQWADESVMRRNPRLLHPSPRPVRRAKIKNIHWHDKTPFFKGGRTWFAVVVRATSSS